MNKLKPIIFAGVAVLHITLIPLVSFRVPARSSEPAAGVMRLVRIQEEAPPPPLPPPPPPPERSAAPPPAEPAAEATIETVEAVEVSPISQSVIAPPAAPPSASTAAHDIAGQIDYFPMRMVSVLPLLPEEDIARAIVYPSQARRLNIEGMVTLELFIDRHGAITDVRVIREEPPNRGFGQAAVNAFRGIRAIRPAQANGVPVPVRFRYNLRFTLR